MIPTSLLPVFGQGCGFTIQERGIDMCGHGSLWTKVKLENIMAKNTS